MEKLFEFRNQLNVKKVVIVIIILIIICLILFIPKIIKFKNQNSNPNSVFISNDNSLSIELSKQYAFSQYIPTQEYILELRSSSNVNLFVSHKNLIENKNLTSIVSADKDSYIKNFTSYSNLSEVAELTISGYPAYSYSFHYLDSKDNKTSYYLQIIWIETENGYYILDIEFPLESLNTNYNIINELINNFKMI